MRLWAGTLSHLQEERAFSGGGSFLLEKEKNRLEKQLLVDLKEATGGEDELRQVSCVLGELFPKFRQTDSESSLPRPLVQEPQDKSATRVSQPRIFPAYFHYEMPETIFSLVELDAFIQKIGAAANASDSERIFGETLDTMEKGALKRDDFLGQLAQTANSMPIPTGKAVVHAAMRAAHKYTYDMLANFGEAGHVLRIVLRIAQRLPASERPELLAECIRNATDDTMALNVECRA